MFGERKRTFKELQILILKALKKENLTVYEIAKYARLHFNVAERQLILLKGQDYVKIDFEHKRFRLYAITPLGVKHLRKMTR